MSTGRWTSAWFAIWRRLEPALASGTTRVARRRLTKRAGCGSNPRTMSLQPVSSVRAPFALFVAKKSKKRSVRVRAA